MAIIGVDVDATNEYTCKEDKVNPTRWTLGTLSSRVLGVLMDQSAGFKGIGTDDLVAEFKGSQAAYKVVQFGLRGWTNFLVAAGTEIPFETIEMVVPGTSIKLQGVPDALMELIPVSVIRELADEIDRRNRPTAAEGKPSGA